jgi:hypothetical protein
MTGGFLRRWIECRRAIRRLWQQVARELISRDERFSYYTAQRLAAWAGAAGDRASFVHCVKVAAEVAQASPMAHPSPGLRLDLEKPRADLSGLYQGD